MPRFSPRDITSSYGSISALNANFDDIAEALDKAVVLDGEPVVVESDFDLNHYKLRNLGAPALPGDALRLADLESLVPETALSAILQAESGAGYVGAEDTGPGSLWTTVQGFINHLFSSAGSAVIGFIQSGVGAVARFVQDKLRDTVHVKDFGAVCDGTADDTAAVQACITASAGKTIHLPSTIRFGALTLPAKTHLKGPASLTELTVKSGAYTTFNLTGSDITVENIRINGNSKTSGYEFNIDCGNNTLERLNVTNILGFDCKGGISDSGTAGYHITTRLHKIQFRRHNGPGLNITRSFAFFFPNEVTIDYVNVPTSDYTGFYYDGAGLPVGAGGAFFRDCDVLGTAGTTNLPNQRGFDIRNTAAVGLFHCRADTLGERGYEFNNVNKLSLYDVSAGLCASNGFRFTTVFNATFNGVNVYGRNGLVYAPANIDGINFVSGCYSISGAGGIVRDCTGHGVHKAAAQAGTIDLRAMTVTANIGRGVKSVGNSAFHFSGTLTGNAAGNYDLGGTLDYISSSTINTGAVVTVGPGPLVG